MPHVYCNLLWKDVSIVTKAIMLECLKLQRLGYIHRKWINCHTKNLKWNSCSRKVVMMTFITAMKESSLAFYADDTYVIFFKNKIKAWLWMDSNLEMTCRNPGHVLLDLAASMYFTRRNWIGSIRKSLPLTIEKWRGIRPAWRKMNSTCCLLFWSWSVTVQGFGSAQRSTSYLLVGM